jgi:hypothetical protein
MSLLLLFASELEPTDPTPATSLVVIPENFLDFHIDAPLQAGKFGTHGTLANQYVRFVVGFEVTWSLGNIAHLRCQTVDPFADDPTDSYRAEKDEEVTVSTRSGLVLFRGNIVDTRERALKEPNVYTVVEVEAVDKSEPLAHRYVTQAFGGNSNPVALVFPGNPTHITTRDPHGLVNGDTVMVREVVYAGGGGTLPHPANGMRVVTVDAPNSFTVPVDSTGLQNGIGGTISQMLQLRNIVNGIEPILNEHGITVDPLMSPGPWIEKVAFHEKTVYEVLRYLTTVTGWPHRILPEGILQYFEAGSIVAPFTIDKAAVGSGLRIHDSRAGQANRVIIKYGSALLTSKSEQHAGDGATRVFPLKYRPASSGSNTTPGPLIDHRSGAGGAARHVGVWGIDTLHEWVYRHEDNALVQLEVYAGVVSTQIPAGQVVETQFPIQFPQTVTEQDNDSVNERGPREAKFDEPEIFEIEQARNVALAKLAEINEEPRRAVVPTTAGLVWPGAVVNVDLPHRHMTGQWLVSEVSFTERSDGALEYVYQLIEGTKSAPGWRDRIRDLFGGGGSSASISGGAAGGPVPASPSGLTGVGGSGSVGRIPIWIEPRVIADSPAFINPSGAVEVETDLVSRGTISAIGDITSQGNISADVDLVAGGAIWTPRVHAPGNLTIAPNADILFDPGSGVMLPQDPYSVHIGAINRKFLTLHASELWVENLVAQDTMATIGGRLFIAPSTNVVADVTVGATSIRVKHNNLINGDTIRFESNARVEFMRVTSNASGSEGDWTYSVTRNLDGSGLNEWYAGDSLTTTDSFIDVYSLRGAKSSTEVGPTIVGNVRTGSAYNAWEPRWAIGNLNGLYGYTTNTFGTAFGNPNGAWVKIDSANGIRIGHGITNLIHLTAAGSASFVGSITAASGTIANFNIIPFYLYSGTGVTRVGISSIGSHAFWAGGEDPATAPFEVTATGALRATNATITGNGSGLTNINGGNISTGTITAIQIAGNTITGDRIAANTIQGANILSGTITADKLNVTTLSAITGNIGTVTAGTITGVSITAGGSSSVTINSSGVSITAGTGVEQRLKWSNGAYIYASGSNLSMNAPTKWTVDTPGASLALESGAFWSAQQISLGTSGAKWGEVWIAGDIHQTPGTTTASDQPMVYSITNGIYYRKTNGFSGTVSNPSSITVQNGIVTSVSG